MVIFFDLGSTGVATAIGGLRRSVTDLKTATLGARGLGAALALVGELPAAAANDSHGGEPVQDGKR